MAIAESWNWVPLGCHRVVTELYYEVDEKRLRPYYEVDAGGECSSIYELMGCTGPTGTPLNERRRSGWIVLNFLPAAMVPLTVRHDVYMK